jgi:hypothetical protein
VTRKQQEVVDALLRGARVWYYSSERTGWIVEEGTSKPVPVRRSVLDALESAGIIEKDDKRSFYREGSGSDIVLRLTTSPRAICKVSACYTVSLSTQELTALYGWSSELGYNVKRPTQAWVSQVLKENGTDAIIRAKEWQDNQDKERHEQRTEESAG